MNTYLNLTSDVSIISYRSPHTTLSGINPFCFEENEHKYQIRDAGITCRRLKTDEISLVLDLDRQTFRRPKSSKKSSLTTCRSELKILPKLQFSFHSCDLLNNNRCNLPFVSTTQYFNSNHHYGLH